MKHNRFSVIPHPSLQYSIPEGVNGDLQRAAKVGDVEKAQQAIEGGADINALSPHAPIVVACWWGHFEILKLLYDQKEEGGTKTLLDCKVSDEKYGNGGNIIHIAASRNQHELLEFLGGVCKVTNYDKDSDFNTPMMVIGKTATGKRKRKEHAEATKKYFGLDLSGTATSTSMSM